MPRGHVGISYFHGEIVKATNASFVLEGNNYDGNNYDEAAFEAVPLSQVIIIIHTHKDLDIYLE